MINILIGKTLTELKDFVLSIEEPKYRGEQLFGWIYKEKVDSFEKMTNLSEVLKKKLSEKAQINSVVLESYQTSEIDGTVKILFKLFDNKKIESVLIPPRETAIDSEKRFTICVSTQVGCPLDCKFCATATMGFERNLTAGEIIEQIILSEKLVNKKITNVVFMGMGEPMLNYTEVFRASDLISDEKGMFISKSKITISTAGYVDGIKKMGIEKRKEKLAVSLHSLSDEHRIKIMPIAKKHSVYELIDSIKFYEKQTGKNVMFEYILFKGFNDRDEDVRLITKLNKQIECRFNIIPFHDIKFANPNNFGKELKSANAEEIQNFSMKLRNNDVLVFTRKSSGADIDAACGQLVIKSKKNKLKEE